jgi:hypothetical protein
VPAFLLFKFLIPARFSARGEGSSKFKTTTTTKGPLEKGHVKSFLLKS